MARCARLGVLLAVMAVLAGCTSAGLDKAGGQHSGARPERCRPGRDPATRSGPAHSRRPRAAFATVDPRLCPGLRRARSLDRPPPKTNAGGIAASDGKSPQQSAISWPA